MLPQLTRIRNEVVFYLGLLATIAAGAATIVSDTDLDSLTGIIALFPAIAGFVSRNFAYGPETVKALEASHRRR